MSRSTANRATACTVEILEQRTLFAAGAVDSDFSAIGGERIVHLHDGRIITLNYSDDSERVTILHYTPLGAPRPKLDVTLAPKKPYSNVDTRFLRAYAVDGRDRLFIAIRGGVVCILPNGKVDKTFGVDGVIAAPLDNLATLFVQSDGKLLATGSFTLPTDGSEDVPTQGAIVRLTSIGKRDATFGPKGIQKIKRDFGSEQIGRVAQDSQGRLVFELGRSATANETFASTQTTLMRMNIDGTIDTSFAKRDGVTFFASSVNLDTGRTAGREERDFAIDQADRIIIGLSQDMEPLDENDAGEPRVLRVTPDGQLDSTFDEDGVADPGIDINHLALDPQGRVVATGETSNNGTRQDVLERLLPNGSIDQSFGAAGRTALAHSVNDLDVLPNGSILVATFADDTAASSLVRHYRPTDGPTIDLTVKNIRAETSSRLALDLMISDDDAVLSSSLDNRDLRITGPNGFVAYAKFDSLLSRTNGDRVTFARYRLAAPGGGWDASDNGVYIVTLVNRSIVDSSSHGAEGRVLGRFLVHL